MRVWLAAFLVLLPAPAFAQAIPAVDLVAKAFVGLADGEVVSLGGPLTAPAHRSDTGTYAVTPTHGISFNFRVFEVGACIYNIRLVFEDGTMQIVRIDANRLTGLAYAAEAPTDGVNKFTLAFEGAAAVHLVTSSGQLGAEVTTTTIGTGLTLADLETAARAFRTAYCPGG